MANEKELTELYSGPGAESFRVFEDENGRVRAVYAQCSSQKEHPRDSQSRGCS